MSILSAGLTCCATHPPKSQNFLKPSWTSHTTVFTLIFVSFQVSLDLASLLPHLIVISSSSQNNCLKLFSPKNKSFSILYELRAPSLGKLQSQVISMNDSLANQMSVLQQTLLKTPVNTAHFCDCHDYSSILVFNIIMELEGKWQFIIILTIIWPFVLKTISTLLQALG